MPYISGNTAGLVPAIDNYLPGIREDGRDNVAMLVNTTGSTGPLFGGGISGTIATSKIYHNVATSVTYTVGAVGTGNSLNGTIADTAPAAFTFYDVGGTTAVHPVTITGSTAAVTFRGNPTAVISGTYVTSFTNITGNTWLY